MDDERTTDLTAFRRMAREFPVRTCIFTFGLPAVALAQLVNGVVHDGPVLAVVAFAALAVACSVKLTQLYIAAYRRERLTRRWLPEG